MSLWRGYYARLAPRGAKKESSLRDLVEGFVTSSYGRQKKDTFCGISKETYNGRGTRERRGKRREKGKKGKRKGIRKGEREPPK